MEKRLMMFMAALFLMVGTALAQTKVNGTVTSQDDGQPVIGASVLVVGTQVGTVTDANGRFSLTVPAGKKTLRITYVGMEPIEVSARPNMRIMLTNDQKALDEVIVVAYGTAKKSSFTGSAAAIGGEKITSRPVTNLTKALDGQVTGVMTTSGSGQPGESASVVIRGFGSINASNSPLYVVDGVPFGGSISSINPQDIESMTVLKDASASALYGARAANGVVIVTTKKGKEGRPQVHLHNTVGWSWRGIDKYETVDQKEFVQLTYEALRNGYQYGNGLSREDASAAAIADLGSKLGGSTNPELYNPFKNYTWNTIIDPVTGKVREDAVSSWDDQWYDAIYNKGALRHEHTLSMTGGSDRTNYMLSLGYINEDGILVNTGFQRYNARANVDSQITDWFKTGLNTNLAYTKSTYNQYSDTQTSNPWYTAQFMAPIYPTYLKDAQGNTVYDDNGEPVFDYGETGRPVANDFNALGDLSLDKSYTNADNASVRSYMTFGSDKDSFGFAKGLKFTINIGIDYRNTHNTETSNKYHGNAKNANGRVYKTTNRYVTYTFGQQLNWNRKFGDHTIGALFGHEYYEYKHDYLYAAKANVVDGIDELRPAATLYDADSYSNKHAIESWLGRVQYNYKDKYYFDASLRSDGSSRFHKDNRWGTFWSLGGNWRISAEEFMKNVKWVSNLSLKASYGENGNESLDSYYAWQNLYSLAYPNANRIGGFVSTLENKEISWEKNGMLNIGLEGALLDSRLRFSIEYFNKKTTDMLLNYPMALSTGFTGYDANVGNMRNWGWEFMLSGTLLKTKDFVWNLTWMGTIQRNKVLKLTGDSNEIMNGFQIIKEGYDITTFYMPRSAGVDPATGQQLYWAYESMDDDGNVTGEYITTDYSKASASRYFEGQRTPDLYGSISTDMKFFDCIDLSILTTYSIGGKVADSRYNSSMMNLYFGNTWNSNILRRWQNPGDVTDIPRVEVAGSVTTTSNYLVNASYFAIKNITLGYTLPKRYARKAYLESVRIYGSFDNVAVFTHLKGMDPQYNLTGNGSGYAYVPNKNFTIGLDINF
jgi:TonB-linked SusC/RagA family outer membrane protein